MASRRVPVTGESSADGVEPAGSELFVDVPYGEVQFPTILRAFDAVRDAATHSTRRPSGSPREIYLEPFRIAIRNSKPWAVMSAYNRVNGSYACENEHTLNDILKGEWGYDGIVMSDWFGTYDREVPNSGLDLEMPGSARWMEKVMLCIASTGSMCLSADGPARIPSLR